MIAYRNLRVEEAQKFWDLMNQLDHETKYMLYEPGERKENAGNISRIESLILESLQGDDFLLVAEEEGRLLGYISAQRGNLKRILHSAYIVVGILKSFTNKGIGTKFFEYLDAWALDKKISRLELTVVCENAIARHLYEKSGFVIEGVKRNSVLVDGRFLDEYYMAKILLRYQEDPITIGVFSSSSPISATVPVRYLRGKQYLENKGFRVVDGSLYGKKDAYRSGSIEERVKEFNELLYNDDVRILMAAIGGNNTNSILPYIDYEYLKKHPKIIIGYSDTTALLLAIYAKTGLTTFYGPALASSFGELPPFVDMTFDYFKEMVCDGVHIPYTYMKPEFWTDEYIDWSSQDRGKEKNENDWICVKTGRAQGRLIGGNLNTMEGFFGTEYMPEIIEGDILFIEDSLKDACTIERSFSLLKLAGVFDKVSGIILGKHEKFDDNGTGRKPYEILLEVLGNKNIPILADFDCCHTHPMFTMPIGCEVELDATNKCVTLMELPLER